MDQVYLVKI